MKKLLLSCFIILCSLTLQAQGSYKRAHKLLSKFAYADALRAYERIYKRHPSDSISIRIAACHAKLNQPKQVVAWYRQVQHIANLQPEDYMLYGNALESLGDYQQALYWYHQYAASVPGDIRTDFKIQGIEHIQSYYKDSALYQLTLLNINSASYDFAPAFFQRGIAFVSSRHNSQAVNRKSQWDNTYFLDIYYAQSYRQGRFEPPLPFSSQINSRMHEGAMAFSKNFSRMVFTRNNYLQRKQGVSEEGINKLKLYFAQKENNRDDNQPSDWGNIKEFPFNSDNYSVGEPTVSADFKTLIFTSDMPGGNGGTDLYISTFEPEGWSKPKNLGSEFNTEGNERSPFLCTDGRIFFASDGRDGLGGLDIYEATPTDSGYIVRNMGYPLNSRMDDFGLILDVASNTGYFTSSRPGGVGMDDIYSFRIKKTIEEKILSNTIIDTQEIDTASVTKKAVEQQTTRRHLTEQQKSNISSSMQTKRSLNVCIEVRDKDSNMPMVNTTVYIMHMASKSIGTFVTDHQGLVCAQLAQDAQYLVKAAQIHYLSDCLSLHIADSVTGKLQAARPLMLEKLKVSQKMVYDEIFFDRDDFSIREDAAEELNKIVAFIKSHPGISVELSAHTDARGTSMYNEALSLKRARSSREYIISKGINPEVITAKGYGEYMLTNNCADGVACEEEQHQQNRRTEIKITDIRETEQTIDTQLYLLQQKPDANHDYNKECEPVKLIPAAKWISVEE